MLRDLGSIFSPVINDFPAEKAVEVAADAAPAIAAVFKPASITGAAAPPVATVAIDGGKNAAILACQMIALSDDELAAKIDAKRAADAAKVLKKDAEIASKL